MRSALLFAWCATTAAATITAASVSEPLRVDSLLLLVAAVISTLSGVTSLALRIHSFLLAGGHKRKPLHPLPFVTAHMGGSYLAGLAAFIVGNVQGWNAWTTLLAVLMLSFLGSKALEAAAERWLNILSPGGKP